MTFDLLFRVVKEALAGPFLHGMAKMFDISGTYNPRTTMKRSVIRNADDLLTPTVQDDITEMRGDFRQTGRDMRKALDKHPAYAE